jgi:hypothetical protein
MGSGAAGVFVDKYEISDALAITFGLVIPNAALSHSTHNPKPTLSTPVPPYFSFCFHFPNLMF